MVNLSFQLNSSRSYWKWIHMVDGPFLKFECLALLNNSPIGAGEYLNWVAVFVCVHQYRWLMTSDRVNGLFSTTDTVHCTTLYTTVHCPVFKTEKPSITLYRAHYNTVQYFAIPQSPIQYYTNYKYYIYITMKITVKRRTPHQNYTALTNTVNYKPNTAQQFKTDYSVYSTKINNVDCVLWGWH